jgi:hypothetical protein
VEWQVGLLPNLSDQPGSFLRGQLLLRPWAERNQPFIAASEKPEDTLGLPWQGKDWMARGSEAVAFTPKVFFGGQACQLDFSAEPRSREDTLVLRLTEQPMALAELRITGSFVHRLLLSGGPYLVLLNQPPASVKVPLGRYQPYRLWLQKGKAEAYFSYGVPLSGTANVLEEITGAQMPVVSPPPPQEGVVVDEQHSGVLAVGGPLTNCVWASHHGHNLALTYRLMGAGGGSYKTWPSLGQPQFTITNSGRRIASSKFEFG